MATLAVRVGAAAIGVEAEVSADLAAAVTPAEAAREEAGRMNEAQVSSLRFQEKNS